VASGLWLVASEDLAYHLRRLSSFEQNRSRLISDKYYFLDFSKTFSVGHGFIKGVDGSLLGGELE